MKYVASAATLAIGLATFSGSAESQSLAVNPLFSDHMVVQRGRPITLNGEGPAGATVTVRYLDVSARGEVDAAGRWEARLPPVVEGLGDIEVTDSSGGSVRKTDVAVGDVFLCSGQSNMDLAVSDTSYPRRTADEAEGLPVRILKVRRVSSARPETAVIPEIAWSPVGPASLPGFSAACWHMAKTISSASPGTTIGLVQASWGGASIEDWLSPEVLGALPEYAEAERLLQAYADDPEAAAAERGLATDAWARSVDSDAGAYSELADDESAWGEIAIPGAWERSGIQELLGFDGIMWFRRSVDLSAEQASKPAVLTLGRIDERDQIWVNGHAVGSAVVASQVRAYTIPPNLLKAGQNVIAVRVIDERGSGGLLGRRADLHLDFEGAPAVNLAGPWRYRVGSAERDWTSEAPVVPWAAPGGVSTMWNGMIAPLRGFPLKGVAWYQGESNAAEAEAYGQLLSLWADSWREFFDDPELPLVVAQLPGFGSRMAAPSDGDWARLREAQRRVASSDVHMGLAVLIDLGISYDIHPAHKDEAGRRLGQEMLRVAYGRDVLPAPSPVSAIGDADGVVLRFDSADGGLVTYGSHDATAFELCDAERVCRFVSAEAEGATIRLPADPQARQVRYAWQGSPPVNLYGPTGLPVVPFAIDIQTDRAPSGDK